MTQYYCETCGQKVVGSTSADAHRELGHVLILLKPEVHNTVRSLADFAALGLRDTEKTD